MNEANLTEYVVLQLGKHVSRNDVIFELCHISGMPWDQASSFVRQVEAQQGARIAQRQSPLFIIIGIGILIGGIALVLFSVSYLIQIYNTGLTGALNVRRDYSALAGLVTGIAMILGSLLGLWRVFLSVIPK